MAIEKINGTPAIVLAVSGSNPIVRWIVDPTTLSAIASSSAGPSGPVLDLNTPTCLEVGDKAVVSHTAGGCGGGLYGCATVKTVSGSSVGIEMDDVEQNALPGPGINNGAIARALDLTGWVGLLAIYSRLPSEDSPPGLMGAIDKGTNVILISGGDSIAPGDRITLPAAGIVSAQVKTVQKTASKLIAVIDQVAQSGVTPSSPAPLSRQGALLSYTKLLPVSGACGQLSGVVDHRDILNLPSAAACGCDPCQPLREVGCYAIVLIQGSFNPPGSGYALYTASTQFVTETGRVLVQSSIMPELTNLRA